MEHFWSFIGRQGSTLICDQLFTWLDDRSLVLNWNLWNDIRYNFSVRLLRCSSQLHTDWEWPDCYNNYYVFIPIHVDKVFSHHISLISLHRILESLFLYLSALEAITCLTQNPANHISDPVRFSQSKYRSLFSLASYFMHTLNQQRWRLKSMKLIQNIDQRWELQSTPQKKNTKNIIYYWYIVWHARWKSIAIKFKVPNTT